MAKQTKNVSSGGESFMVKLATFIVDKRNLFFLITIILLIFSMFSRTWVEVENDLTFYLPEESETKGYDIEAAPRRGYFLRAYPLSKKALTDALHGEQWLTDLIVLPQVDSTNNYLKQLAANGAPDGTAVLSIRQTAGRGRRGRSFLSEPGAEEKQRSVRSGCW